LISLPTGHRHQVDGPTHAFIVQLPTSTFVGLPIQVFVYIEEKRINSMIVKFPRQFSHGIKIPIFIHCDKDVVGFYDLEVHILQLLQVATILTFKKG
jgi:hypothetical protein